MGEHNQKGDITMTKCSINDITINERIREDMGNIAELAESMGKYGLIHPVVLDADRNLVAGGRRLEAARVLGWTEVEVRFLGELSDRERRLIEVEENIRRKDLTEYERSQRLMELMEAVKEVTKEEPVAFAAQEVKEESVLNKGEDGTTRAESAQVFSDIANESDREDFRTRGVQKQELEIGKREENAGETCTDSVQVSPEIGKRGPALTPGSLRDVSARTGIPVQTFQDARRHVETVKDIPALVDQPKMAVIQAGRELRKMNDPQGREEYKAALAEHPEIVQKTTKPTEVVDIHQKLKDKHAQQMEDIDAKYDRLEKLRKGVRSILDLSVHDEVELQQFYNTMVNGQTRIPLQNQLERLERASFVLNGLTRKLRAQLSGQLEAVKK